MECIGDEWSGMEGTGFIFIFGIKFLKGEERRGVDRRGSEWIGLVLFSLSGIKLQTERNGQDWRGEDRNGRDWFYFHFRGLNFKRRGGDWTGPDWSGEDRNGLERTGFIFTFGD